MYNTFCIFAFMLCIIYGVLLYHLCHLFINISERQVTGELYSCLSCLIFCVILREAKSSEKK